MIKINHYGRLGNNLFQDIGCSILAKKHNLHVQNYKKNYDKIKLNLHQGNRVINDNYITITDDNVDKILQKEEIKSGLESSTYFQTKFFVTNFKNEIQNHFLNLNEDKKEGVFVHVRLDDAASKNPGMPYYEMCLNKLNPKFGYVSSDTIHHPMIYHLCQKYNLSMYENTPDNTILFAKNFENVILSGGTFSWWIGFLSNTSNVFYPKNHLDWHGDIFVYKEWNGISC